MAPSPAASARTFISYAREDSEFVMKLARDLRGAGADIWLDRFDIPVGDRWDRAVQDALDSCGRFLVVLSPASVGSDNVMAELNFALDSAKRVFPVLQRDCKRPLRIHDRQYADFTVQYQSGLEELLSALGVPRSTEPKLDGGTGGGPTEGGTRTEGDRHDVKPPNLKIAWAVLAAIGLVLAIGGLWALDRLRNRRVASHQEATAGPSYTQPGPGGVSGITGGESNNQGGGTRPGRRTEGMVREPPTLPDPSVPIPPGEFLMGAAPEYIYQPSKPELPQHPVRISRGFSLGQTPVIVAAYTRFARATSRGMPGAPDFNPGWAYSDHPIVNVSWDDAQSYCAWMGGRLPTEAEWEYAARGGKVGLAYPWGQEITRDRANYGRNEANYRGATTPVMKYQPQNDWGLHDMVGNVQQWVADWYDPGFYATLALDRPTPDPIGPPVGRERVLRGGGFGMISESGLTVSFRSRFRPNGTSAEVGFRCVSR